jgi:hypothetical protein
MNVNSNRSTVTEGNRQRCMLVGIPAKAKFVATPGLKFAIDLAARVCSSLSLYVFAPDRSAPRPNTPVPLFLAH